MNKLFNKITPEIALRVGLGAMYVYSGIDIIRHPTAWFWAVRPLLKWLPVSMQASLGTPDLMTKYLYFQGAVELLLALVLIAWFVPRYLVKWVALISTLEFAGILILLPIDAITFRDIGLLGAFVALWLIMQRDLMSVPVEKHDASQERKPEHHESKNGELEVETFDEFMKG